MVNCYINALRLISAQDTFDQGFSGSMLAEKETLILSTREPDYKAFIAPAQSRRMSKGIKMGVACALSVLKESGVEVPDAIIAGTGWGCSIDSEKFLRSIIDNNEELLTPTSFIQSTHNTVAAQIALMTGCRSYNFTYVNGAVSFESALLDAQIKIQYGEAGNVLVGGVDERGILSDMEHTVLSPVPGKPAPGEGAGFFMMSEEKGAGTYAELADVTIQNSIEAPMMKTHIMEFLDHNQLRIGDIDLLVSGGSQSTVSDFYFGHMEQLFRVPVIHYKHLSGEYYTASTFGLGLACHIIREQAIPEAAISRKSSTGGTIDHVLLYNQYQGKDHSFILLKRVQA